MSKDNVVSLSQPGAFEDQLTDVLHRGARTQLAQAVEAEVAEFLAKHAGLKTEDGRARVVRLVGFTDGARESAQDWRDLLLDLKRRGLDTRPELVIADGALGFWKAAGKVWPRTCEQGCWVHKTANVLAKLPKSQQPKAKRALQEIWMAETKAAAVTAFDAFIESYQVKYEKAADCLAKDRDALVRILRFPGRALEASQDDQSDREHLRHRAPPHDPGKRLPL